MKEQPRAKLAANAPVGVKLQRKLLKIW